MRLAIITAYTPRYKSLALLSTPSHKCLAARAGAEFFELPMADDGAHAWHKIDFIQDWLSKWHAVLWLDADCIAPASWSLPTHRAGQVYFFPWMKADGVKFPQTFASLWINAPESFALLNAMRSRRLVCDGPRQDTQALFQSLQAKPERQRMAGVLDRGLIHFQGDYWDKLRKLNGQSIAA